MPGLLHPNFLFLFIFLFFTSIAAQSPNNPNCATQTCGNLNISYPFWKIDNRTATQFCGYPGFGINCSNDGTHDIPSIHLGGDLYYVKSIADGRIVLIDYDVAFPVPDSVTRICPRVHHRIELETLPLNFRTGSVNISFHFNCTDVPPFASPIPCLDSLTRRSCVSILNSEPESFNWDTLECEDEVVTTVFSMFLPDEPSSLGREYPGVVRNGFELNWQTVENCGECESSNGGCGYNNKTMDVMCFCDNGTATKDHCGTGHIRSNKRLCSNRSHKDDYRKIPGFYSNKSSGTLRSPPFK